MARHTIRCSAQDHASRQGQAGWASELGHVDLPEVATPARQLEGYLCGACGAASQAARAQQKRKRPMPQAMAALARAVEALADGKTVDPDDLSAVKELASS